jgi:hypothetical protein
MIATLLGPVIRSHRTLGEDGKMAAPAHPIVPRSVRSTVGVLTRLELPWAAVPSAAIGRRWTLRGCAFSEQPGRSRSRE